MRIVLSKRYTFKTLRNRSDLLGGWIANGRRTRRQSATAFLNIAFGE